MFAADKMDFSKEDVDPHVSVLDVIEAKRVLCDPANRKLWQRVGLSGKH